MAESIGLPGRWSRVPWGGPRSSYGLTSRIRAARSRLAVPVQLTTDSDDPSGGSGASHANETAEPARPTDPDPPAISLQQKGVGQTLLAPMRATGQGTVRPLVRPPPAAHFVQQVTDSVGEFPSPAVADGRHQVCAGAHGGWPDRPRAPAAHWLRWPGGRRSFTSTARRSRAVHLGSPRCSRGYQACDDPHSDDARTVCKTHPVGPKAFDS